MTVKGGTSFIGMRVSPELIKLIDKKASELQVNRSEYIRMLIMLAVSD